MLIFISRLAESIAQAGRWVSRSLRRPVAAESPQDTAAFLSFFHNTQAVALMVNTQTGAIIHANKAAAAFYGYSPEQMQSLRIQDITVGAEPVMAEPEAVPAAEERVRTCARHRLASGEVRDVDVFSNPVDTPHGHLDYVIVVDATRRRAAEELHKSLFNQSNDVVLVLDVDGRCLQVNQRAISLFGYSAAEFVHKPYHDLIVSAAETQPDPAVARLLAGERIPPYESAIRCKDGLLLSVEINIELVRDSGGKPVQVLALIRDITERKWVERALQESQRKYRLIAEHVKDVIITFSPGAQWTRSFVTSSVHNLLGYQPEELIGGMAYGLFHPDDRPLLDEAIEHALHSAKDAFRITHRVQHKDGHYVWVESSISTVRDPLSREPVEMIAIVHEITKRKQMEDALRDSEERYKLILQATRAATWEWNVRTGETVYNQRWAEIVGYTLEELAPISIQTWIEHVHPQDLELSWELLRRHFVGELPDYECEVRMRHKDGHWIWVWDRGRVMEWDDQGRPLRVMGTHVDITERKRVEDALRQSEEKYRLIAENTSDGIMIMDGVTQKIIYASPAYDRQFGRSMGSSEGMDPSSIWDTIHPDDRDLVFKLVYGAIDQKSTRLVYTYRSLHRDGHYLWREDHTQFSYAPDGTFLRANIVSRDVTERKLAEERELALRLERERVGLLAQFASEAAHEFRTPLSIIGAATYLLLRSDDPEQRRQKAVQINEQIGRMTQMVDRILLLVKLEGNEELSMQPVDLGLLLGSLFQQVATTVGDTLVFKQELPDGPLLVRGNNQILSEALRQLLDNACRFTPPEGTITMSAGMGDGQVWVEVADSGIGIADEDLPHIFKTFWRKDAVHSTAGFGLGLSIVDRIVHLHGATIDVKSQLGEGSRFRILFPAVPVGVSLPPRSE